MTALSQPRLLVAALMRKRAKPLSVLRLRRHAEEFCHQWAGEVANKNPRPSLRPSSGN